MQWLCWLQDPVSRAHFGWSKFDATNHTASEEGASTEEEAGEDEAQTGEEALDAVEGDTGGNNVLGQVHALIRVESWVWVRTS